MSTSRQWSYGQNDFQRQIKKNPSSNNLRFCTADRNRDFHRKVVLSEWRGSLLLLEIMSSPVTPILSLQEVKYTRNTTSHVSSCENSSSFPIQKLINKFQESLCGLKWQKKSLFQSVLQFLPWKENFFEKWNKSSYFYTLSTQGISHSYI